MSDTVLVAIIGAVSSGLFGLIGQVIQRRRTIFRLRQKLDAGRCASPGTGGTSVFVEDQAKAYQQAIYRDGIPSTSFASSDVRAEQERLKGLGVVFHAEPPDLGGVTVAIFDDSCGNLIQCPSSPHPHLGFSCDALAQEALGHEFVEGFAGAPR